MNSFLSSPLACCVWLVTLLFGSVTTDASAADASQAIWKQYLYSSPFSYSTNDSIYVVNKLSTQLDNISLSGADPRIAAHVRAVKRWLAAYPAYRARASAAYDEAYRQGKVLKRPTEWVGGEIGKSMADKNDRLTRAFGGALGELIGGLANEAYSQSNGEAAAASVMRPLLEEARALSEMEFQLDRMLGVAPTNHLRRLVGRFGGRY
ncbi:hypothetical protein DES53_10774 [Roseimicrobium gellanilyticum]|uniref:Uncharacterized protein n=1 Tax=Roseimicrobium gellanilyticum TaxID=748857 RepID=A0A366HF94_9BACT|nr:hypothetical protein [Roseimicrobium gellanilyticum]RBP41243.1 hypothetical protein DES53_10774 [Roseimicrobium gellanilyticum]